MRNFFLFLLSLFIGIVLFVWIYSAVSWQEIKNILLVFAGWQGIAIVLLTLLMMVIGSLKWKEILKGEGVQTSFWMLFKTYLAGFAVMFLAPILFLVGEIFRSLVLKEKTQIPWSKAVSSVIIDRILEWTTNVIVIIFGMLFFLYKAGAPPQNLIIIFGGAFLLFITGISLFYLKTLKKESLVKAFIKVFNYRLSNESLEVEKEIFAFFKPQKKAMWTAFGFAFSRATVMYFRTLLLISFLGKKASGLATLSILGFNLLVMMVPIPAALGSHEVVQIFAFNSLKLDSSAATAFTLIIRGAELIVALIGLIILFQLGLSLVKNKLLQRVGRLKEENNKALET